MGKMCTFFWTDGTKEIFDGDEPREAFSGQKSIKDLSFVADGDALGLYFWDGKTWEKKKEEEKLVTDIMEQRRKVSNEKLIPIGNGLAVTPEVYVLLEQAMVELAKDILEIINTNVESLYSISYEMKCREEARK